jgi:hypothetical protein
MLCYIDESKVELVVVLNGIERRFPVSKDTEEKLTGYYGSLAREPKRLLKAYMLDRLRKMRGGERSE